MVYRARPPRHSPPDVVKCHQDAAHSGTRAVEGGALPGRVFATVARAVVARVSENTTAVRDALVGAFRLRLRVGRCHPWRSIGRPLAGGEPGFTSPLAPAVAGLPVLGAALVARPKRRMFVGHPGQAGHARLFVTKALEGCPVVDTAILLTDELVINALVHTRSGGSGSFEVIVWRGVAAACVAVLDGGSDRKPSLCGPNLCRSNTRLSG
jgi:hypothetical protein